MALQDPPWDRGNPYGDKPPQWSIENVEQVLRGIYHYAPERYYVLSPESERQEPYDSVRFTCGCVVYEDRGWDTQHCSKPFHKRLEDASPRSTLARHFHELQTVFHQVLEWAWRTAEHAPKDEDLRMIAPSPLLYREAHDVAGQEIWQSPVHGSILRADLTTIPLAKRLTLHSPDRSSNLSLELTLRKPKLEYGPDEHVHHDVTRMSASDLIALIERDAKAR